jgi:hypothetical protein
MQLPESIDFTKVLSLEALTRELFATFDALGGRDEDQARSWPSQIHQAARVQPVCEACIDGAKPSALLEVS